MYNRFAYTTLLLAVFASSALWATTRKVLFLGNSYTYTNDMPTMLQSFTTAMGDTLVYDQYTIGGYTLQQHSTDATAISKIFSQQWDVVVLQEQSELPSFPPAQVATDVYPYARALDSMIHANDSCTQTMFLMTWGHQNGDPANCGGYPTICTYEGMQGRLRESYIQMMQDNNAVMAPVGAAWKVVHDSFPTIALWMADSSHPVVAGSYLETAVLYSSIFHRRALGCSYLSGLPATDAATIQRIADKVSVDSIGQWLQYGHYPYAAWSHTQPVANTLAFTNHSMGADHYAWSFGDMGSDTATNPMHTYLSPGIYTVALTVSTNCFTETRKDTVHVGIPTYINEPMAAMQYPVTASYNGNGRVLFTFPAGDVYHTLEVYDSRGSIVVRRTVDNATVAEQLAPGLYLYRAFSADHKISFMGKIAQ